MGRELHRTGSAVVVAVVLTLVAAACGRGGTNGAGAPSADDRLAVVTTVAPITSIVAGVAGDLATVTGLVPEGTNSHTFEPPPSAAKVLSQADVVFVNGLELEEPTVGLARELAKKGSEIVQLGDRTVTPAEYIYDFSFPEEGGKPNPHLWTNPPMARQFARVVADTLKRRDAADAAAYEANFERFAAKVDELDRAMVAATATLPPERRKLLTYHDAYAYFARHYGWTVIGALQPSNFEEPTPRDVGALIDQVRREGVPAIFGSEVFPSPVLEQIGRETGVRYVDVLRDDDLPGKTGDAEHSWLGLMRFDFVTMVEALGGDASALRALDVSSPVPDRATYPQ
ncbi:MAG TPA: metal ABC transporter substrate-binding protein [Acidimicrobiales bacterium]|nr:metal ABC transporter substrate-binding protein [Acidimicrobiales bacterium]